jgi:hypothetical protein
MGLLPEAPAQDSSPAPSSPASSPEVPPKKPTGRAGLKHIGGYFDPETVELVAILRARLSLDNSQLIKRAVEELYNRETAARKFGDK